jgi:hypothetical protein
MSTLTHMATGISVPAISLIAGPLMGAVKPAYVVVDARRPVSVLNCESRGLST